MTQSDRSLALVKPLPMLVAPKIYNEDAARKRMCQLRQNLLRAAAAYVVEGKDGDRSEGKDGCRADRLRTASDLSGIPLTFIDVAAKKMERGP